MRKIADEMLSLILLTLVLSGISVAAEKIQFATAVKVAPAYYLPMIAAEKNSLWSKNGLDAEWVPFRSNVMMHQAIASGAIKIGADHQAAFIRGVTTGLPSIAVAGIDQQDLMSLVVLSGSRIKHPQDLKGARVGVASIGGVAHAYGMVMTRILGVDKDVRFVGTGGIPETVAAVKAGAVDAASDLAIPYRDMIAKGEVRELARAWELLKGDRLAQLVFSRPDFARTNPDIVKRVVKAVVQSVDFIVNNRDWAVETMKSDLGYSPNTASWVVDNTKWLKGGKIPRPALENAIKFGVEGGLFPVAKSPKIEELYTPEFVD